MQTFRLLIISGLIALLAACGGPDPTPSVAPSPAPSSLASSTPTVAPTAEPTPTPIPDDWVATTLRIESVGIEVEVAKSESAGNDDFPDGCCAFVLSGGSQPGRDTNSFIFAHALEHLFKPLWRIELGAEVVVEMSDGHELVYLVTEIHPNVVCTDPEAEPHPNPPAVLTESGHSDCDDGRRWMAPASRERLTLQTSQGYNRNYGELVVVAEPAERVEEIGGSVTLPEPEESDERSVSFEPTASFEGGRGEISVEVSNISDEHINELLLRLPDVRHRLDLRPIGSVQPDQPLTYAWTRWVDGAGVDGEPEGTLTLGWGPLAPGQSTTITLDAEWIEDAEWESIPARLLSRDGVLTGTDGEPAQFEIPLP